MSSLTRQRFSLLLEDDGIGFLPSADLATKKPETTKTPQRRCAEPRDRPNNQAADRKRRGPTNAQTEKGVPQAVDLTTG
jgi:hypothetical protein